MTTALAKLPEDQRPPTDRGMAELKILDPLTPSGKPSWGLVKQTSEGEVIAVQVRVRLDEKKLKHYGKIPGSDGLSILAPGYDRINQIMGVSRILPKRIFGDDGKWHDNPWHQERPNGGLLRIVYRIGGYGRNSVGNMVLVTTVLYYEVAAYFANEVYNKWLAGPKPQNWGDLYSEENLPPEVKKDPKRKCIYIPDGMILAVDLTNRDALDLVWNRYNKLGKAAQRIAETIGWERVLRVFAGQRYVDDSGMVAVTAWIHPDPASHEELEKLAAEADSETATVETVTIDGMDAEMTAAVDAQLESEDQTPPEGVPTPGVAPSAPPPPHPAATPNPELAKLRAQIRELYVGMETQAADAALAEAGIEGPAEVAQTGDVELLKAGIAKLQEAKMKELSRGSKARKGGKR